MNDNTYDGNVLEISFGTDGGKKKKWRGNLNIVSGNIFQDSNFSFPLFGGRYNRNSGGRKRGLLDDFFELFDAITTSDGTVSIITMLLGGGAFLLGYIFYRYMYLIKREKKLDFVDLAMRRRFI
jgi:hypothetical protein